MIFQFWKWLVVLVAELTVLVLGEYFYLWPNLSPPLR